MKSRRDENDFDSQSIWEELLSPFRQFSRTLGELLQASNRMGDDSFSSKIIALLWLPVRLFTAFVSFMVQAWASTRPGYAFIRSIPVFVVLFMFFGMLLVEDFINTEGRSIASNMGYLNRQRTLFPDLPHESEWFAKKLVEIKPDEPYHKYELALSRERCGENFHAYDIMTSIAPEDEPGFANAHVWLAQYYDRAQTLDWDIEKREATVRKHLALAVEAEPENQFAHLSLARRYREHAERFEKGSQEWEDQIRNAIKHQTVVASGRMNRLYDWFHS